MGSFSWTRADHTTKRSNISGDDSYKILIPKEHRNRDRML